MLSSKRRLQQRTQPENSTLRRSKVCDVRNQTDSNPDWRKVLMEDKFFAEVMDDLAYIL